MKENKSAEERRERIREGDRRRMEMRRKEGWRGGGGRGPEYIFLPRNLLELTE
jgi:hypothetical protein